MSKNVKIIVAPSTVYKLPTVYKLLYSITIE